MNTVDITDFQAMVVTIGVTIRKKNQPTGGRNLWADFELQFDTFPPIRGNPEETLNVDVGLIYCCGSFYIGGGRATKEIWFITHAPLLQKLPAFQQSHWPKHP